MNRVNYSCGTEKLLLSQYSNVFPIESCCKDTTECLFCKENINYLINSVIVIKVPLFHIYKHFSNI